MTKIQDLNPEYITDKKGRKKSVVIPIEEFEELLEDIEDLVTAAERKDEPTISHKDLLDELKKDDLI